jgi:hypothetical protein
VKIVVPCEDEKKENKIKIKKDARDGRRTPY